tara:strand:+ start:245 stop:385 length:141 start_codon:yes stop_codon:yes gene_type:complete
MQRVAHLILMKAQAVVYVLTAMEVFISLPRQRKKRHVLSQAERYQA